MIEICYLKKKRKKKYETMETVKRAHLRNIIK